MGLYYVLEKTISIFSPLLFEPPKPLRINYYRCDTKFHLESIKEMYNSEDIYGLVLASGTGYKIYQTAISGKHVSYKLLMEKNVKLPKQQKKGGQSAQRFGRIRDSKVELFIKNMAEHIVLSFLKENNTRYSIKSLFVAGPAETKFELINNTLFRQYFANRVASVIDTQEINDSTIHDLLPKITPNLTPDNEMISLTNEFLLYIQNADDRLIFGHIEAEHYLNEKILKKILINKKMDKFIKDKLLKLNDYNCEIIEVEPQYLSKIGVDIIGIRFY